MNTFIFGNDIDVTECPLFVVSDVPVAQDSIPL
jgi:hypothetical protein